MKKSYRRWRSIAESRLTCAPRLSTLRGQKRKSTTVGYAAFCAHGCWFSSTWRFAMIQPTPVATAEQWIERLHAWAVERWGEARARAIRAEIEATAQHLVTVANYPLGMEQIPGFFIEES
jgi:hypothetical protein